MTELFNLAGACYLRPLGYAVDARYATKVASRNRSSSTSIRWRDKQH